MTTRGTFAPAPFPPPARRPSIEDIFLTAVGGTLAPEAVDLGALLTAPGNQQTGSPGSRVREGA